LPVIARVVVNSADDLDLLSAGAKLLFQHGQTTERTVTAVERLGAALGCHALLFPHWGEIVIRIDGPAGLQQDVIAAQPAGIDMNKVVATMKVIDQLCNGRIVAAAARSSFEAISRYAPVGAARFAVMAAAGAAALGVIFGTMHWLSLVLIGPAPASAHVCAAGWPGGVTTSSFNPFAPL